MLQALLPAAAAAEAALAALDPAAAAAAAAAEAAPVPDTHCFQLTARDSWDYRLLPVHGRRHLGSEKQTVDCFIHGGRSSPSERSSLQ
jgi:hypothetical protein